MHNIHIKSRSEVPLDYEGPRFYTAPEELARIDRIMADIRKEWWQRAVAWFCYATLVLIACIAAFQIGRGL